jgi:signal transduction histidine kinase
MTAKGNIAERRLRVLHDLAHSGGDDLRSAAEAALEKLATLSDEIPFAAVWVDGEMLATVGISEESAALFSADASAFLKSAGGAMTLFVPLPPVGMLLAGLAKRERDPELEDFLDLAAAQLCAVIRKEESRAAEQLMLLVSASSALLADPGAPDVLKKILDFAQRFVAADAYALWRREGEGGLWRAVAVSGLSPVHSPISLETDRQRPMPPGTLTFEDVFAHEFLAHRWSEYRNENIQSLISVPLRIRGSMAAVIGFYYRTTRRFSKLDVNLATAVGNLAAAAMDLSELCGEQEQLRQEAESGRRRALFLARAGAMLGSSLEIHKTLQAIAELAVPEIADYCTIDLADETGRLQKVSVYGADAERTEKFRAVFEKYPIRPDSPLTAVLESGKSMLFPDMREEHLRAGARSEEHLEILRATGLKSTIIAPLQVHGEKLGVLSLFTADSCRRYGTADVEAAEEMAARAAMAVHSAKLHDAAKRSAERLRIAASAAGLGIFEWDLDSGRMVWENSRMFEIFARTEREGPFSGNDLLDEVIHPDDADLVRSALDDAAQPVGSFQFECRVQRADCEWRVVEFAGRRYPGRRLLGVAGDITERQRLEERLRQAEKLESIGVLAGGVAHDFNNLLTGIMGHSSLALEALDKHHAAAPMIENVMIASERAAGLTRQILAYSGRGKFVLTPVSLSELFHEISALIRVSLPHNADVHLELEKDLPEVLADATQMQQLAMNLVINAAESLDGNQGDVTVRTGAQFLDAPDLSRAPVGLEPRPGRFVWIEIRDTGCGMDDATLRKIFDPFFTTKFTGRGLGLSAVQGIVRGHKGFLDVVSAPGAGTTFRVYIPEMRPGAVSNIIEI